MKYSASERLANGAGASVGSPASPLIDEAHLGRQTLGDPALRREILELFKADARQRLATLASTVDPAEWRRAAHSIKGTSRTIGAFACGDIAERLEKSGLPLAGDLQQQLVASQAVALDLVLARIDELLRSDPAGTPDT